MPEPHHKVDLPEYLAQRAGVEEDYHDRYAEDIELKDLLVEQLFEAPTAIDNQYILEQVGDLNGKRILDLACGAGESAVYFASKGAEVSAVDISQGMLTVAEKLAESHGVKIEARKMRAEALEFEENYFDIVYGYGALHHIDLEHSATEIHRVLKKGGLGVFVEPLGYNPTLWFYRLLAKEVRTKTEKPFFFSQLRFFKDFAHVAHKEFWFSALLVYLDFFFIRRYHPSKVRYWRQVLVEGERYRRWIGVLKRIDNFLLGLLPPLRYLSSTTVIILRK
jgi:2-polyprenyl-3-methyl-5-hydroxy-6-metoxy-1,4-benzoquinol methylase